MSPAQSLVWKVLLVSFAVAFVGYLGFRSWKTLSSRRRRGVKGHARRFLPFRTTRPIELLPIHVGSTSPHLNSMESLTRPLLSTSSWSTNDSRPVSSRLSFDDIRHASSSSRMTVGHTRSHSLVSDRMTHRSELSYRSTPSMQIPSTVRRSDVVSNNDMLIDFQDSGRSLPNPLQPDRPVHGSSVSQSPLTSLDVDSSSYQFGFSGEHTGKRTSISEGPALLSSASSKDIVDIYHLDSTPYTEPALLSISRDVELSTTAWDSVNTQRTVPLVEETAASISSAGDDEASQTSKDSPQEFVGTHSGEETEVAQPGYSAMPVHSNPIQDDNRAIQEDPSEAMLSADDPSFSQKSQSSPSETQHSLPTGLEYQDSVTELEPASSCLPEVTQDSFEKCSLADANNKPQPASIFIDDHGFPQDSYDEPLQDPFTVTNNSGEVVTQVVVGTDISSEDLSSALEEHREAVFPKEASSFEVQGESEIPLASALVLEQTESSDALEEFFPEPADGTISESNERDNDLTEGDGPPLSILDVTMDHAALHPSSLSPVTVSADDGDGDALDPMRLEDGVLEHPDPELLPLPTSEVNSTAGEDKEEYEDGETMPVFPIKPDWSVRAHDAPALGLSLSGESHSSAQDDVSLPGSFPSPTPSYASLPDAQEESERDSSTDEHSQVTIIEEAKKSRSPIDLALAMQLRPGLGMGADAAWMVRFLMSAFGWLAVLVARSQPDYVGF